MKKLFFKPWVGAEYASGGIFGKRILVLGESHYTNGEPNPDMTTDVVNEYLSYDTTVPSYLQSFNKFERSLIGAATDVAARRRIWDSVVFYNYLQTPMSAPRQAVPKSAYADSAAAFFEVLETYRPEYVIVWGYRLWDAMPADRWEWGEELSFDGTPIRIGCYALTDGTRIKVAPVKHPSAGYTWETWHRYLQSFLQCDCNTGAHETEEIGNREQNIPDDNIEENSIVKEVSQFTDESEEDCGMVRKVTYQELPHQVAFELCRHHRISTVFHDPYSENVTADILLPKIQKAFLGVETSTEDYTKKHRRTLGILDKMANIKELQYGKLLISIGLDTYSKRGKTIRTQILNEPAERPFTEAPENVDYPADTGTFCGNDLLKEGLIGECVFYVENKERAKEPYILCQECKGSGKIKCPTCQGSGREQYVDGYFANGEERIKTGICSDCQGSGKINCPECDGVGKIEMFAPIYSVVKSVQETISQVSFCAYSTPWNSNVGDCYVYSEDSDDWYSLATRFLSRNIQEYLSRDGFIRISMKNRKEKSIDCGDRLMQTIQKLDISDLYKRNEETIRFWLEEYNRGNLICRKEQHYLLPISRLTAQIPNTTDVAIYLLPYDNDSTIAIMDYTDLDETGFLKYIFYKLFK